MTDLETIRVERRGAVLVAKIDHPDSDLNAIDERLHRDLATLFGDLRDRSERADMDVRAVLLTATGPTFSAGGDFSWFPQLRDPVALDRLHLDARRLIEDLLASDIPIVAAVNGPAVGLAASIVLLCDVVIMSEGASLADPHVRVGLAAGDGGTVAWPLAVGPMLAKRFLLTGDPVSAAEAERLGLAAQVVPDGGVFEAGLAMAHRIAGAAPLAVRATKRAVNAWVRTEAGVAFGIATQAEIGTFASDDHREALEAISQRRPPHFTGM